MKLPKILTIQKGHVEEPSNHYEAPRDVEELVTKSQRGMQENESDRATSHAVKGPETISVPPPTQKCHRIFLDLDKRILK
jgi:hypothetical protein